MKQEFQLSPATSEQGRRGGPAPLSAPARCLAPGTQPRTFSEWTFRVLKLCASSPRPRLLAGQQREPRAEKAGAAVPGTSQRRGPSSGAALRPPTALTRMPFTTVMFSFSSASKVTRRVLAVPPMAPASVPAESQRGPASTSGPTRTPARESPGTLPLPGGSKATTPRSKEKAPVPKARLLRSRARSRAPRVGPRGKPPASSR